MATTLWKLSNRTLKNALPNLKSTPSKYYSTIRNQPNRYSYTVPLCGAVTALGVLWYGKKYGWTNIWTVNALRQQVVSTLSF